MKKFNLSEFTRGWFIGNFDPSILKTDQFEVAVITHKKGENWPEHFHKISSEFNVVIQGKLMVNDNEINLWEIFVIEPGEIVKPIFLEDCKILCIKVPSDPKDKYTI